MPKTHAQTLCMLIIPHLFWVALTFYPKLLHQPLCSASCLLLAVCFVCPLSHFLWYLCEHPSHSFSVHTYSLLLKAPTSPPYTPLAKKTIVVVNVLLFVHDSLLSSLFFPNFHSIIVLHQLWPFSTTSIFPLLSPNLLSPLVLLFHPLRWWN